MNDPASGSRDKANGDRLVPLPKRAPDGDELLQAIAASPSATVADLLERTDHLLDQLGLDIASLKDDQDKERRRIEQEAVDRQEAADDAIDILRILASRARVIAERKGRVEDLDRALAAPMELDRSITFPALVAQIEQEIRYAKGITGAIRLQVIGDLLKQATRHVEFMTRQAERSRQKLLKETEQELKSEGKEARASYEIGMSVVRRDLKALDLALPPSGLGWDDSRWERWEGWEPLSGSSRWIRLGTYYRPELERFRFPILAELPGPKGFVLDVATGSRETAIGAARSVILRLLASHAAGDCRFTFIDPAGLGDSVAPFLPLGDFSDDLIDGGVVTLEDEIEEKLTGLTRHIEMVIKTHLRGEHDTIDELHRAVGEIVEPYRFVFAFDFPLRMSDRAKDLLRNVIDNGPRCGVYTFMTTAPGAARANGARWKGLLKGLEILTGGPDGFHVQTDLAGRWLIDLDQLTDLALVDADGTQTLLGRVLTSTGEAVRQDRRAQVTHRRLFELQADGQRVLTREDVADVETPVDVDDASTWWTGSSARGLGVPIGRSGSRDLVSLWLDSGARSGAVVGGERGSGISTLLHAVVTGLAMTYSPDELALYLVDCDPVGGTDFTTYAREGLPHARVVATDAGRPFVVSVLDGLVREMTRRTMLFAPHGGERAGIEGYRRDTGEVLPRIVAMIDGIDRAFAADDRLGDRAAQLFDALTAQGAAYGIHLVVASHRIGPLSRLGRRTLDHLHTRIALACSEDESKLLLGGNDGQASQLEQAGQAVLNLHDGDPVEAERFRTAQIEAHEVGLTVRDLRRRALQVGLTRTPQVFDGQSPARLEDSGIHQLAFNPAMQAARLNPRIWLGEPAALGAPVEVSLRRNPGANLLLVGRDERLGQGLLGAAVISAALGHGRELDLRVLDLMPLEAGFGELLRVVGEHADLTSYRRRNRDGAFQDVLDELDRRIVEEDFRARPVVFVINGLGAGPVASLEAGAVSGAAATVTPADIANPGLDTVEALERIVARGPEVGVHAIVWTDRLSSLSMHVTRATMREFAQRVVMQMPAEDSAMLVDSAQASTLEANEALLYDEDAARLTAFKPYQLPSIEHVANLVSLASSAAPGPTAAHASRPGGVIDESDATMARLVDRVARSSVS